MSTTATGTKGITTLEQEIDNHETAVRQGVVTALIFFGVSVSLLVGFTISLLEVQHGSHIVSGWWLIFAGTSFFMTIIVAWTTTRNFLILLRHQ